MWRIIIFTATVEPIIMFIPQRLHRTQIRNYFIPTSWNDYLLSQNLDIIKHERLDFIFLGGVQHTKKLKWYATHIQHHETF